MTPPILNLDALDLQPRGHGVTIPGAGQANGELRELRFLGRANESLEYGQGE